MISRCHTRTDGCLRPPPDCLDAGHEPNVAEIGSKLRIDLATGQQVPGAVRSFRELVFIYNESVHEGELPKRAASRDAT